MCQVPSALHSVQIGMCKSKRESVRVIITTL